jgi:uncharacterized protein YdeI (YjbR/CyaY-like superfamily)
MSALPIEKPEPSRLDIDTLEDWRAWLIKNSLTSEETWIVMKKGLPGRSQLTMKDAIDEAICYGWIDSRTRRLDEERYEIRFTPRKSITNWSERNLKRARELVDQGRMTELGMSKLPADFQGRAVNGKEEWVNPSPEFVTALKDDPELWRFYSELPLGRRREFNRWILQAKRSDTRQKRIQRTLELIGTGRSLTEDMMDRWSKN